MQVPTGARCVGSSWSWSSGSHEPPYAVLGVEPKSSERVLYMLSHWAVYLAPWAYYFILFKNASSQGRSCELRTCTGFIGTF